MFVVGGESLIDLVSQPRSQNQILQLEAHAGGSPYNCAIALARLGNKTGFLCPISRDGFGDFLMEPLESAGVKTLLEERVVEPSTLAVVTLDALGQAQYEFYRGADRALDLEKLVQALPAKLKLFQVGGFCPIEERDANIWLTVAKTAAKKGAFISMDPNVRPSLVPDFEAYKTRLADFFDLAHLIKLSVEDLEALDKHLSVEEHCRALLARENCEMVIVTNGERGSEAYSHHAYGHADVYKTGTFGDTVGAGDSLMAGVLTILAERGDLVPERVAKLNGLAISDILRFGSVVAGLNCEKKGAHPPTRGQVDLALSAG